MGVPQHVHQPDPSAHQPQPRPWPSDQERERTCKVEVSFKHQNAVGFVGPLTPVDRRTRELRHCSYEVCVAFLSTRLRVERYDSTAELLSIDGPSYGNPSFLLSVVYIGVLRGGLNEDEHVRKVETPSTRGQWEVAVVNRRPNNSKCRSRTQKIE